MGTRLIQQKRGKGTLTYKSPGHRFVGPIFFPSTQDKKVRGEVADLINCPGHRSPLAYIVFEDGQTSLIPAALGLRVGEEIESGPGASARNGSIMTLKEIPTGSDIFSIELTPGGDSKIVRCNGGSAKVVDKDGTNVILKLPSRKRAVLNERCRAVVGIVAGGGRRDKPFMLAGNRFHDMASRNKKYPNTHGIAMNACSHPFGGTHRRTKGRSKSVSRNAPPGRKVGSIASRRTGIRKR